MSENINEIIAKMYEEHREKLRRLAECIIHDYYASYDMVEDTFLHLVIHAEWLIKLTEPMKIRYPEFFKEIIEDELNVKAVEFTDDVRAYSSYSFKPQLKTVGPKYGKLLGQIRQALSAIDGNAAMDELNANGMLTFDFGGEKVELTKDDLLIDIAQTEGFESASDNGVTVVLDTNLSPELIEEGFVRELISKIQTSNHLRMSTRIILL